MANLNDLAISSLSSLSLADAMELMTAIRERRRYSVPPKIKSARQPIPTESVIAKMSEAQLTELYNQLMQKKGSL